MPVDPVLVPLLEALAARPKPAFVDAADRRRQNAEARATAGDVYTKFVEPITVPALTSEETVPVTQGEIRVQIYRPAGAARPLGGLVHYHGGGWWSGDLDEPDPRCHALAVGARIVVVDVEYRLAPEHPFPIPLEDCYEALTWTVANAERLGINPERIGVSGESAGGNLAAAVALLARDRGGPTLSLQLLEIPALDLRLSSPSAHTYAAGPVLPRDEVLWCVEQYLGDHDRTDPLASPLLADDLSGLPPAFITAAECDPLADDASGYARRLAAAGVAVEHKEYAGHVHGSQGLTKLMPTAREWRDSVVAAAWEHLGQ